MSANNPRVKRLARLTTDRRARRSECAFVVEGPRALATFVACGGRVEAVFTDDPDREEVSASIDPATTVHVVERRLLDRIADAESPQGLVAICELAAVELDALMAVSKVVVLEGVQDPGNVGAIVRVAAAVAADAVVCTTGCADPYSPRAVRGSAGTLAALKVVTDIDAGDTLERLGSNGFWRLGTTMAGGSSTPQPLASRPVAVVFGGEGAGLSDRVIGELDEQLSIPMAPNVESLNVAVTAGIVLYRLLDQAP